MKRVLILALTFTIAMQFLPSICYVSLGGQTSSAATSIKVKGLKDSVTIRRDERGIPYIDAKNDEDLYFAQGYVTAQDRLWQMDLFRRNARGELSEVLPNVPNSPALDQDKLHRTLGFSQVVEAEVAQASPQSRAVLEAYAAGVNAYISTLDQKSLPPEFRILGFTPKPWTPADSLIVIKIFFEALSNTWRLDLMREAMASLPAEKRAALFPEISPIDVVVVGTDSKLRNASTTAKTSGSPLSPEALSALAQDEAINRAALEQLGFYAEGLAASNNWVVSGKHTTSGKTTSRKRSASRSDGSAHLAYGSSDSTRCSCCGCDSAWTSGCSYWSQRSHRMGIYQCRT
jgi:penicillin amidase